jgi:hypothetical protein
MQAAGSKGGHNHWTLDGACPDTGRRHYERLYHDDVVLSPTFYRPEQSAGDAERKLFAEMMIINGVCKQKAGFDRLMRAFADASGGPRGGIPQLEAAMNAIQIQGVGRETTQYIASSCQLLFGQECRESFTLSQCAVIAEKFFQNRRSLPAVQVADCHAYAGMSGASTKVPLQATNQTTVHAKSHGAQPPMFTSRSHGDILSWKHGGTERSHFDGLIPQTPPIPH